MEAIEQRPVTTLVVGGFATLMLARALKKFLRGRKQIVLEVDLEYKEFRYSTLTGVSKLVGLLNPNLVSVADLIAALDIAAKDWRVVGLICRLGGANPGLASTQDIRDAVLRLRAAGKHTVAYADNFASAASSSYYLATAFDKIYLSRSGMLMISGMAASHPFIKQMLGKCGIEPRLFQREEYKNFTNLFTEEKFTEAHAEVTKSLIECIFGTFVAATAERLGQAVDVTEELYGKGPFTAAAALKHKLVDGLKYRDEIYAEMEAKAPSSRLLYLSHYLIESAKKRPYTSGKHKVALITAEGQIADGPADTDMFGQRQSIGSDTTCADIRAAVAQKVKAIIFRVDSGGGSYSASDAIKRELDVAKAAGIPVVAWMGNVAGSGGYLVSMGADKIVTQGLTLTGSIGVIMGKFLLAGTYDKLGITFDHIPLRETGEDGTLFSTVHDLSEAQREKMNDLADEIYEEFKSDAAKCRNMPKEKMDELAKGRVYCGSQAVEMQLTDVVGDLETVMREVRTLCKLRESDTIKLMLFPKKKGILAALKKPQSSAEADRKAICPSATQSFLARFASSMVAAVCQGNPLLQTLSTQLLGGSIAAMASNPMAPTSSMQSPTSAI